MRPAPEPTRTELSGRSAVTFLVLLLLLGGVDTRSAEACGRGAAWPAHGVVLEPAVCATDREVRVERHHAVIASGTEALRLTTRSVRRVRTVADAMLPCPRAPDGDRV